MVVIHGRKTIIYINGVDLSGEFNAITPLSEQELHSVTVFGHIGMTNYPGLAKDKVTLEGLYTDTERAVFEGMIQQTASGYGVMIQYGSTSQGARAHACGDVLLQSNSIKSVVTDVNKVSVDLTTQNTPFENCRMLTSGIKTVASGSTANGTSYGVDSSATTGGAAYLQVFTATTSGTLTITVEMSSTGAWAGEVVTTCTFAAASSAETQRIAITSQIYTYNRVTWANTGTSAQTFAVALKKD